jgi:hypothetical protein
MKFLSKIIFILILIFSPYIVNNSYAIVDSDTANLTTWSDKWKNTSLENNNPLKNLKNATTDFTVAKWGQEWIYNALIRIARDLKNLFFMIAGVYFLVLVIKLLFSEKTEEASSNFKKWVVWISIWIIVTQIAYYLVTILFDKDVNIELANNFVDIIIQPFISLLETSASFIFIFIMIYSFFSLVTANWDEEKAKSWKMSVLYAIMWFIVIKVSKKLVDAVYGKTSCSSHTNINCTNTTDIKWVAEIIVTIINWINWFIWLIVIILIIYAWFMVLTSIWDEEKLKKAKSIIIYIAIWLFILVANYLILTFIMYNV